MVRDKVDSQMISKTKLDSSFPDVQFYMKSYTKLYRLDGNSKRGCIILYVWEDIPSTLLNPSCIDHEKEYFLVELILENKNGKEFVTIIPKKPWSRDI